MRRRRKPDVIEHVLGLNLWRISFGAGGCRPMSDLEVKLWKLLQRTRRELATERLRVKGMAWRP